jgi:tetratricopeptide (TPR) repeat protein
MDKPAATLQEQIDEMLRHAQFDSVIAACERVLDDEDADTEVTALLGLNMVAFCRGEFAQAGLYLERAEKLAREKGSPRAVCDALCRRCFLMAAIPSFDDPNEQVKLAQEALALAQQAEYPVGGVNAKVRLGFAQMSTGAKAEAEATLKAAVEQASSASSDAELDALTTLATLYFTRGMPVKAIDTGNRALKLARGIGDDLMTSVLLVNMNYYYSKITNDFASYNTSINYSRQGLVMARTLGYFYAEVNALFALARAYYASKQYRQVAETYAQALALVRKCGNKIWENECLTALANMYHMLREYEQVKVYAEQELALATEMNQPRWNIHAWNMLSSYYQSKGNREQAQAYAQKARDLQKQLGIAGGGGSNPFSRVGAAVSSLFDRSARK